jgi:PhzF family phenazine biosynthesis protein
MQHSAFKQVDVFTAKPYFGNALAVVMDGSGMSDADMQRFARWTNLAETTFLLPPTPAAQAQGADYRVRIFTPGYEMPFAGHPTIGSCHAWLEAGGTPKLTDRVVQECPVGLIQIRRTTATGQRLAFAAPPLQRHALASEALARVMDWACSPARCWQRNISTTAPSMWVCWWTAWSPCWNLRPI